MSIDFRSMAAAAAVVRHEVDSAASLALNRCALLVILLACSACRDNMGSTARWATFEHASVQGVALSDKGKPLDSVAITFRAPPDRGSYRGGTLVPLTGPDGTFQLHMERLSGPLEFTPPSPDTLTVMLIGAYRGGRGSEIQLRDTAFVLLHFAPEGQAAEPSSVELHITVP